MNQDEGGGRDDRECDGGATAAAGDQPEEQPSGSKDKKVSFVIFKKKWIVLNSKQVPAYILV